MCKNNVDKQYLELLDTILTKGVKKEDRTGTGTISIFDYNMKFDMSEGFPLITSKKMYFKGIVTELLWFIKGRTDLRWLLERGNKIWVGDAYKKYMEHGGYLTEKEFIEEIKTDDNFSNIWGNLGPIYGKQWRDWDGIDQLKDVIENLKINPDSRRLIVNAWNPSKIPLMVLPPCHVMFQFYTREMDLNERCHEWCKSIGKSSHYSREMSHKKLDILKFPKRKISLKWIQRSVDSPLGLPYNTPSYGLLLMLIGKEVNMIPESLGFSGGDCHIYKNQIDGVRQQLKAETYKLPTIEIEDKSIFDLEYEDIKLIDYKSSPKINFPLSN